MGQIFAGRKISICSFSRFRGGEERERAPIPAHCCCYNLVSLTTENISVAGVNKINISNDT